MNKNYELTLEKEILREAAWEVLARIHKLEETTQDTSILKAMENEVSRNLRAIPEMTLEEVETFKTNSKFLNVILKSVQGAL